MNPYQQNLNIMKGFFKRPIILVFAIISLASIFTAMISGLILFLSHAQTYIFQQFEGILRDYLTEFGNNFDIPTTVAIQPENNFVYSLDLMTVLIGLAFIFFFVKSRSSNPLATLKAPTVMFRVYAMITFVCTIIAFVLEMITVCAAVALVPTYGWVLAVAVPLLGYLLAYGISIYLFSGSLKASQKSIYLSNRGAGFFGIMNFISACLSLSILVIQSVILVYSEVDIVTVVLTDALGLVPIAASVILGIIALSYSSYIKQLSEGFVYDPIEQSVDNPEPAEQQNLFCRNCGQQLGPDDYFCNHCGTPIKK